MTCIPTDLLRLVIQRAGNCCEYCRTSVADRLLPFEIDHVIAEKHGGVTNAENLCLACIRCNGLKGGDIASADPESGAATFLFNPCTQHWGDRFSLDGAIIRPLAAAGRVTVFHLRLSAPIQIAQRTLLIAEGRYPCATAA
jgi:hypothetical protein